MLRITIPDIELYDEETEEFTNVKGQTITLEHSLVSISKWESKWCKPFLTKEPKTPEETLDYIRCMTITQNVNPVLYTAINDERLAVISEYIDAPMTATVIRNEKKSGGREIITSELIYYWMVAYNIPFECQKWHLNRLLTLVNICNIKNAPPKKMTKAEIMNRNRMLNETRKQQLNTKG